MERAWFHDTFYLKTVAAEVDLLLISFRLNIVDFFLTETPQQQVVNIKEIS